jgi:3-oxoacyl-[acyl-carrier-protein] synthase II
MNLRRVVVTGLGALTPIGNTVPDFWNGLLNGVNGQHPLRDLTQANSRLVSPASSRALILEPISNVKSSENMTLMPNMPS